VTPGSGGRQQSPIKTKFSNLISRPAAVHPFAATRDGKEVSPPKERSTSAALDQMQGSVRSQRGYAREQNTTPRKESIPPSSSYNYPAPGSGGGLAAPMSLEDLRRQLVKFVNFEDGTSKTVNVSSCTSGVEVLERVLKKFGKWNTGSISTDESEGEGERLEVDGWGVYSDPPDMDSE
jgi:mitogen-activated protein kinase kinase kinase